MINPMTVAPVLFGSGALVGACASASMASVDSNTERQEESSALRGRHLPRLGRLPDASTGTRRTSGIDTGALPRPEVSQRERNELRRRALAEVMKTERSP